MLSTARTGRPHAMQREPGRTTECAARDARDQTLKKLPQTRAQERRASPTATGEERNARVSSTAALSSTARQC